MLPVEVADSAVVVDRVHRMPARLLVFVQVRVVVVDDDAASQMVAIGQFACYIGQISDRPERRLIVGLDEGQVITAIGIVVTRSSRFRRCRDHAGAAVDPEVGDDSGLGAVVLVAQWVHIVDQFEYRIDALIAAAIGLARRLVARFAGRIPLGDDQSLDGQIVVRVAAASRRAMHIDVLEPSPVLGGQRHYEPIGVSSILGHSPSDLVLGLPDQFPPAMVVVRPEVAVTGAGYGDEVG
nr:hypothetical protein [Nocardia abscessus]